MKRKQQSSNKEACNSNLNKYYSLAKHYSPDFSTALAGTSSSSKRLPYLVLCEEHCVVHVPQTAVHAVKYSPCMVEVVIGHTAIVLSQTQYEPTHGRYIKAVQHTTYNSSQKSLAAHR